MQSTEFIQGWTECIEAIETRLEFIKADLAQKGKHDPWDIFFDVQNAVKEIKLSA